jgi:putative membrane protein insertion efficiency factor
VDARKIVAGILAAALAMVIWDLTRPPQVQVSGKLLVAGIHLYQATLSRGLAAAGARCRFEPTCSHYATASIRRHGALAGSWRSIRRIARCGPWTPLGTDDPPG